MRECLIKSNGLYSAPTWVPSPISPSSYDHFATSNLSFISSKSLPYPQLQKEYLHTTKGSYYLLFLFYYQPSSRSGYQNISRHKSFSIQSILKNHDFFTKILHRHKSFSTQSIIANPEFNHQNSPLHIPDCTSTLLQSELGPCLLPMTPLILTVKGCDPNSTSTWNTPYTSGSPTRPSFQALLLHWTNLCRCTTTVFLDFFNWMMFCLLLLLKFFEVSSTSYEWKKNGSLWSMYWLAEYRLWAVDFYQFLHLFDFHKFRWSWMKSRISIIRLLIICLRCPRA